MDFKSPGPLVLKAYEAVVMHLNALGFYSVVCLSNGTLNSQPMGTKL